MRGYSLLEVSISLAFFGAIAGTAATTLLEDQQATRAISTQVGPTMRLRSALNRISVDLRMAGIWGEDSNHDGLLQEREDLNGNGVLDADWSLADGESESELSFNSRADLHDDDGYLIATGIYSEKVRYLLVDKTLVREKTRYDEHGNASKQRAPLVEGIEALSFTRDGGVVKVRGEVKIALGGGKYETRVLGTRVWLRN